MKKRLPLIPVVVGIFLSVVIVIIFNLGFKMSSLVGALCGTVIMTIWQLAISTDK